MNIMNIEQRKTLAEYLRKQLEINEKEIAELEAPVDPYAELKAAHAAGKRIAFNHDALSDNAWSFQVGHISFGGFAADRYKIVEDDETYYCQPHSPFGVLKTTFTKCALTGKITAEVVE